MARDKYEPPIFALSEGEKRSPLWKRLEEHLEEQLKICRAKNDGPLDQFETAALRGSIRTYKAILGLKE